MLFYYYGKITLFVVGSIDNVDRLGFAKTIN